MGPSGKETQSTNRTFRKIINLLKAICQLHRIPIKRPTACFREIEENPKFKWKHRKPQIAQAILRRSEKNKDWRNYNAVLKIHCRTIVIRTVWHWYKNRYTNPWVESKRSKMSSDSYSYQSNIWQICQKYSEKTVSLINCAWKNECPHVSWNKTRIWHPSQKLNLSKIKDHNVNFENLKLNR